MSAKKSARKSGRLPDGRVAPGRGPKPGTGGRPTQAITLACQRLIDKHQLLAEVVRIATDGAKESDRMAAIRLLLEYGHGKPQQSIDHTSGGEPIQVFNGPAFRAAAP